MKAGITVYGAHLLVPEEGRTVTKIIQKAAGIGFDGIDLGYYWGENRKAEMAEAKTVASDCGIELANYICRDNFGNGAEKGELQAEIDAVKQALDEAAFFNCPVLRIFCGGYGLEWDPWSKKIVEALAVCAEYAAERKIVMALEDHGALCKNSREQLFYINAVNSPYLKANADLGNYWQSGGERPEDAAAAIAGVTAMVHVKDHRIINNSFVAVPVGEGLIDFRRCFRILKNAGYDGYVTLEYECKLGEPRHGITTSLCSMRRFIAEC